MEGKLYQNSRIKNKKCRKKNIEDPHPNNASELTSVAYPMLESPTQCTEKVGNKLNDLASHKDPIQLIAST